MGEGPSSGRSRRAAPGGGRPGGRRRPGSRGSDRRPRCAPSWITRARGHSSSAYGRSWVTIRTVSGSVSRISASSRRAAGSRFDVGSSSTSTSGSIASTVATATRRRWPKLRWCGARSANPSMPTAARACVHPGGQLVAPQAEVGRAEGDVVAHGGHEQLVVGVLEHDADPPADLGEVGLHHRQPADDHLARPAVVDPVEVEDERGLARPVGPEHGHPLPRPHGEVEAVEGLPPVGVGERAGPSTSSMAGGCDWAGGSVGSVMRGHPGGDGDHGAIAGRDWPSASRAWGRRPGPRRASCRRSPATPWPGAPARPARRSGRTGSRRRGERRPARASGGRSPATGGRSFMPPHLVGDHVEVADHEPGDRRERLRHPQPFEPAEQLGHRGGGGEDDGGGHAEGALDHDVPRPPQAGDREGQAQHVDPLPLSDDREEDGEGQERQLDGEAAERAVGAGTWAWRATTASTAA